MNTNINKNLPILLHTRKSKKATKKNSNLLCEFDIGRGKITEFVEKKNYLFASNLLKHINIVNFNCANRSKEEKFIFTFAYS